MNDNEKTIGKTPSDLSVYLPDSEDWIEFNKSDEKSQSSQDKLKEYLLASLQMQNIVVFAGSGTSLGEAGGPSMQELWDNCVDLNSSNSKKDSSPNGNNVIAEIGYDVEHDGKNLEALLSRCDAFLQINTSDEVIEFIKFSKSVILEKCSAFITSSNKEQLDAHQTFLHRMSRRRVRDPRFQLFTTNYDLCFEIAAGKQGLVVIDGFSFTEPRFFDPRFFLYDIVRRPIGGEEIGTPLEGVFHLYKLHGSVNWLRTDTGIIEVRSDPPPESAAIIYPVEGKYQQSYIQPHLEIISRYLTTLREPNTCLIVIGFGFNDAHLSEPVLSAVRTNPHLRLIVVDSSAKNKISSEDVWKNIFSFAEQGQDVCLINATFSQFSEMIPNLRALTPAQRLSMEIKNIVGPS